MASHKPPTILLEDLREQLASGQVIAIVGAGIAIASTNNQPTASWVGLLQNGVSRCEAVIPRLPTGWSDRVNQELESGDMDDLLSAAEKISSKLLVHGGEFGRWLRETVGALSIIEPSLIQALQALEIPLATTNYDNLIEEVTGWPAITWRQNEEVERVLRGEQLGVLHLHGHWRDPDSVVLGIRSYDAVLGNAHAQTMLRAMRATRTLLYIGYGAGLTDPNFGAMIRWAREVFAGAEHRHFRLTLEQDLVKVQAQHEPEDRIYVLPYGTQHSDLTGFLRALAPGSPKVSFPSQASRQDACVAEPPSSAPLPHSALRIVILYKRHAPHSEHLINLLEQKLSEQHYHVFIDRHLVTGDDWELEIRHRIRTAEAVIPLLSAQSIWSDKLEMEVKTAYDAAQQQGGRPRILPVRVMEFSDDLPEVLGAILNRLQYTQWQGPESDESLLKTLIKALQKPPRGGPERVTGSVPLDSPYYIVRPIDEDLKMAITGDEGIVLIRGARQMGKTSLLARGLQHARTAGMNVVITDLQALDDACYNSESPQRFYMALIAAIIEQLEMDMTVRQFWNHDHDDNANMRNFILTHVIKARPQPFVWGLDEVDRLFACGFGSNVFGMFRSWYNMRSFNPTVPWARLTIALAYATEARLFITDLNQSPFNVGTRLTLTDFTPAQVQDLNSRYDSPLRSDEEMAAFYRLLGGQPYLTRRGLHEIAKNAWDIEALQAAAAQDEGPLSDHLDRILISILRDPEMTEIVSDLLEGEFHPSAETAKYFYRLRSAGILVGTAESTPQFRCELYKTYLTRRLLNRPTSDVNA